MSLSPDEEHPLAYLAAFIYSLAVALIWPPVFLLRKIQRFWTEAGTETWPRANGSITAVDVMVVHGWVLDYAVGRIDYSYRTASEYYSGSTSRLYPDEQAAWDFVDARRGKPVVIRYRDDKAEESVLRDEDQDRSWNEPGPGLFAMLRQHWRDELKGEPPDPDLDSDTEDEETADHDSMKP